MPKKIDYKEELKILKDAPDHDLRPITTRVSVACLRKLYEVCTQRNLDLSTVLRHIVEAEVDQYLGSRFTEVATFWCSTRESRNKVSVVLSPEVKQMAEQASAGLEMDLPTLLRLVIAQALPEWVRKSNTARQERREALGSPESVISPAKAIWEYSLRRAPAKYQTLLRQTQDLITGGTISLEFIEGSLYLTLKSDTTTSLKKAHPHNPALEHLRSLAKQKIMRQEPHEESGSKWRWLL